jgi:hypothetical protein
MSGSEDFRLLGGKEGEFTVFRSIEVLMETAVRAMFGNIRLQAGRGFEPIIEIMAGHAAALLVEMIGVFPDVFVAGLVVNGGKGGIVFHG